MLVRIAYDNENLEDTINLWRTELPMADIVVACYAPPPKLLARIVRIADRMGCRVINVAGSPPPRRDLWNIWPIRLEPDQYEILTTSAEPPDEYCLHELGKAIAMGQPLISAFCIGLPPHLHPHFGSGI